MQTHLKSVAEAEAKLNSDAIYANVNSESLYGNVNVSTSDVNSESLYDNVNAGDMSLYVNV